MDRRTAPDGADDAPPALFSTARAEQPIELSTCASAEPVRRAGARRRDVNSQTARTGPLDARVGRALRLDMHLDVDPVPGTWRSRVLGCLDAPSKALGNVGFRLDEDVQRLTGVRDSDEDVEIGWIRFRRGLEALSKSRPMLLGERSAVFLVVPGAVRGRRRVLGQRLDPLK